MAARGWLSVSPAWGSWGDKETALEAGVQERKIKCPWCWEFRGHHWGQEPGCPGVGITPQQTVVSRVTLGAKGHGVGGVFVAC